MEATAVLNFRFSKSSPTFLIVLFNCDKRAEEAARGAINSPLLDFSIDGAKGVLFAIAGGADMTLWEIQEAAKIITESMDKGARVIFGAIHDERLRKNELKITVIAAGFPEKANMKPLFVPQGQKEEQVPKPKKLEPKILEDPPADKSVISEKDSDSWDAIPAFLRRSRKM